MLANAILFGLKILIKPKVFTKILKKRKVFTQILDHWGPVDGWAGVGELPIDRWAWSERSERWGLFLKFAAGT